MVEQVDVLVVPLPKGHIAAAIIAHRHGKEPQHCPRAGRNPSVTGQFWGYLSKHV